MRSSDWSSDVCSSDLNDETLTAVRIAVDSPGSTFTLYLGDDPVTAKTLAQAFSDGDITKVTDTVSGIDYYLLDAGHIGQLSAKGGDRKSVVHGKVVSVRVGLVGRRYCKKKNSY